MTRKNMLCIIAMLLIVLTATTFASAASNSSPLNYDSVNKVYIGTMYTGDVSIYRNYFDDSYYSDFLVSGKSETLYSRAGYEGIYKDLMITLNGSIGYRTNYYDGTSANSTISVSYSGTISNGTCRFTIEEKQ